MCLCKVEGEGGRKGEREKGERERDAGLSKAQGSAQGPLCPGSSTACDITLTFLV